MLELAFTAEEIMELSRLLAGIEDGRQFFTAGERVAAGEWAARFNAANRRAAAMEAPPYTYPPSHRSNEGTDWRLEPGGPR